MEQNIYVQSLRYPHTINIHICLWIFIDIYCTVQQSKGKAIVAHRRFSPQKSGANPIENSRAIKDDLYGILKTEASGPKTEKVINGEKIH